MISQEDSEELAAPLLRSDEVDEFGEQLVSSHLRMQTSQSPVNSSDTMAFSRGPMSNPRVRRNIYWALGIRTMADALPGPMQMVVNGGKMSVLVFLGGYLIFVALSLPFWLLSFLVTEWGVYALGGGCVFLLGRGIIRMIAFPGSSSVSIFQSR